MDLLKKGLWLVLIPIGLSWLAVLTPSVLLAVLFPLSHFLVIGLAPAFRHRENLWMFLLVAFTSVPVNLYILWWLYDAGMLFDTFLLLRVVRAFVYYVVALSIEENLMGIITRFLWKRQYKSCI